MSIKKRYSIIIIIIAALIKFLFFAFAALHAPHSKFENDSFDYLETARVLSSHGIFAQQLKNGSMLYESFRTPGYPLFLVLLHSVMKIPLGGVIFIQIILTIVTAVIVYKAAVLIDAHIAFLSAALILFDPPVTIYSLMIMSEVLFLFVLALFAAGFILYLKNKDAISLVASALLLAAATYVRPISYYLGWAVVLFIVYANMRDNAKSRGMVHALIFFLVVYGSLVQWQLRNYIIFSHGFFSAIIQNNPREFGLFHSYAANADPFTQGMTPVLYYINATWRCFLSLMTRPGSFKYFHDSAVTVVGKSFGYCWMVFWFVGFLVGIIRARRNLYYQFMLLCIGYFIFASIAGTLWLVGERFRVPMMPFLAIVSAYGWKEITGAFGGKKPTIT